MKKTSHGFTLVELLVVIGILGILMGALFPAITGAMLSANLSACTTNGKKLVEGIIQCNTERSASSMGAVWPTTTKSDSSSDNEDISAKGYSSSVDYFKELFDMEKYGTEDWDPYVDKDLLPMLWGQNVPGLSGKNLEAKNIKWTIGANMTDEMPGVLPVLISRNVVVNDLKTDTYDGQSTTEVKIGQKKGAEWDTPFGGEAWVLVTKSGEARSLKRRNSRLNVIYKNQGFTLTNTDNPFSYLASK